MSSFEEAVAYLLGNEGGLNEDSNDKGGITNYGISIAFLKRFGDKYDFNHNGILEDDIRNLTPDQAKMIYQNEFWDKIPFDQISNQDVCNYIFDMAVNMGQHAAIVLTQQACGCVLKVYDKNKEDGILGNNTLEDIKKCGYLLMPALRAARAAKYRCIVALNYKQMEFLNDWLRRAYESGKSD